jgi:FixJ family two-component response regulator
MSLLSTSPVNQHQSTIDAISDVVHSSAVELKPGRSRVERPLVSVVDDDESVREALPDLVREFGFSARAFSSAKEFLNSDCVDETQCLILDVAMPGMSGPELQQELKRLGKSIPIVFITAQKDEIIRQRIIEQGAVACLLKPFSDTSLLEAVQTALKAN